MNQYFQIITGKITELEVTDTDLSLFGGGSFASLPLLGQLALGNNAEAADYLNSVQYFRCKLGELIVHGIFCRAFFRNGDKVEVVVEPLDDGSYYAYALRRPIDHRLWLYPWAMKGTKASNKESFKFAGKITFPCFILSMIMLTIVFSDDLVFLILMFALDILVGGSIFLILFYCDKGILGSGSKDADKIFATLGYPKPEMVNMEEEYMEMFFNNKSMNEPDFYIDVNTDEFKRKDPPGVKWVAFYREAPAIPDYITVIHTEKKNNNKRKK